MLQPSTATRVRDREMKQLMADHAWLEEFGPQVYVCETAIRHSPARSGREKLARAN